MHATVPWELAGKVPGEQGIGSKMSSFHIRGAAVILSQISVPAGLVGRKNTKFQTAPFVISTYVGHLEAACVFYQRYVGF